MSKLEELQNAKTIDDLAKLLGFKSSAIAYILYKIPEDKKYISFQIPKRSGGNRDILSPIPQLKLLQKNLSHLLYGIRDEIGGNRRVLSHGFRRKQSIYTNATVHKNRRYVFNVDIEDFFPSINFGRVRGYFMSNINFQLDPTIATLIAQIAVYKNQLPQGSPCSPIISDMIAEILDARLAKLTKKYGIKYSRYADDLTFSTNSKIFPSQICELSSNDDYIAGSSINKIITQSGFNINSRKTRIQFRGSRQTVTGLVVNEKVNVERKYYKKIRAMCHSLFVKGEYTIRNELTNNDEIAANTNPLEGRLSFIHSILDKSDTRDESAKKDKKTISGFRQLLKNFLFFKKFVILEQPIIICEGKTDNVYFSLALKYLTKFQPTLAEVKSGKLVNNISFFRQINHKARQSLSSRILEVSDGTGNLSHFIARYAEVLKKFKFKPLAFPVIIIIDNDDGANGIFSTITKQYKKTIQHSSNDDYYHLVENLYLIKTPSDSSGKLTCVEDCFEESLLKTKIDGKKFNPNNKIDPTSEYGKHIFAERVVKPNAKTIDWAGFEPILEGICKVINHHKAKKLTP